MIPLLIFNLKHIIRTRLVVVLFIFSFVIQFASLRLLGAATIQIQGLLSLVGPTQLLFAGLVFQIFTGAFLSAIYGIWIVPYSHLGQRGQLTFTLPVSRWTYPLVYGILMFLLLLCQHLILLLCFGLVNGFGVFSAETFKWMPLFKCLAIETLAFEVSMFAFSLAAMTLGQIPTLFLGALAIFVLQISAVLFRFDLSRVFQDGMPAALVAWKWVYSVLPPIGEMLFDLRDLFLRSKEPSGSLWVWLAWLAVLVVLFRVKLNFVSSARASET